MNSKPEKQNAVDAAQAPPAVPQDNGQTPPQTSTQPSEKAPAQQPEKAAAPSTAPPYPSQTAKTFRRRQHYFTNLPNIGLEAQPLTAPWEAELPDGELSDDDYEYPDGYTPNTSNKAVMAIAVSGATIVAVAVLVFLTYIFFFNKDAQQPVTTAPPTTVADTAPTTQPMPDTGLERIVVMPDISGMKEADAYNKLNAAYVRYKVVRNYSEDVPLNYVIGQYPQAGEEFPRSQEAVIYISKGRENEIITFPTYPETTASTQPTTAATTAPASTAAAGSSNDYLLPDSASKRLSKSDIQDFDRVTLNLALNEIFARHGRKFTDPDISAYFMSKSWYHPTIAGADFDMSTLNQYESFNLNLISSYQSEKGYR